jgi:hypothetical protein
MKQYGHDIVRHKGNFLFSLAPNASERCFELRRRDAELRVHRHGTITPITVDHVCCNFGATCE